MRTADVLLSVMVGVIIISIICIWFFPSVQDFMLGNSFWNGLKVFCAEFKVNNLDSLNKLPTLPQGKVLLSIPYLPYSEEELAGLLRFVTQGGTLLLMDDYGYGNSILEYFGLQARFSGSPLLDPLFCYKNPWLPRITDFSAEVKESGIEVVTLNHATALTGVENSQVLAWSSSHSFLDFDESESRSADEPLGPFPIAARIKYGKGRLALVADPSIIINSMIGKDDNHKFIKFLIGENAKEILIDRSHLGKSPLDKSKIRLASAREIFSRPFPLLGLVALIFIAVSRYVLRKEFISFKS